VGIASLVALCLEDCSERTGESAPDGLTCGFWAAVFGSDLAKNSLDVEDCHC